MLPQVWSSEQQSSHHALDPKGLQALEARPEVPSEKPKHKNNSMSKNKIPSSEVPGARPLPVAGTSPFPCSWRSQARLTQNWSAAAILPPGAPPPAEACESGSRGRPRAAAGETAAREKKWRRTRKPSRTAARGPRGATPGPAQPAERGTQGSPTSARPSSPPLVRPERKCAGRPDPPRPRSGSAPGQPPPHYTVARGASGSGQVPSDVAAHWGRLRAGGRAAGPGGAGPGRGAAAGWPGPAGALPPPPLHGE